MAYVDERIITKIPTTSEIGGVDIFVVCFLDLENH